jgi:hypothetical protein
MNEAADFCKRDSLSLPLKNLFKMAFSFILWFLVIR